MLAKKIDKEAAKHVLDKLICMAQEMMMEGHGHSEEAGSKLADAMKEEADESPEEMVAEDKAGDDSMSSDDQEWGDEYRKREMKGGGPRQPISARRVKVVMGVSAPKGRG